jgi:hypothetical protein
MNSAEQIEIEQVNTDWTGTVQVKKGKAGG